MSTPPTPTNPPLATVDAQNPWLGLISYTEENRAYFHGRDDEARELVRRLERKTLTVLFGQSGLGKSSLLQAGVFPRLRATGFVPIYLRLDHGSEAPALAEQIKPAVLAETSLMGNWSHPGSATAGESLWEYFHHRDDVLTGGSGQKLIPVLVFDQFEELFTLGAADDATRARAQAFISELADLVENRAPSSFEGRVDAGTVSAEAFDFARSDYRVLITLREDYLPHLESLKGAMPSLMQNRMRLTRLSGAQALEAVLKPSPGLVPDEVAHAIVGFVSGRNDLDQAEVEPSLLSLVCRELNHRRRAANAEQIDAALLAGSRETILTEFYERTLADQTAAVRHWVENELLTDSGYRENIALERARKSLFGAGADPAAIDVLVSRRLLRIEERLDVRRIELTHDVLCAVVRASRDARREREAREATERRRLEAEAELERARIAELDTRRSLVRARLLAGGAALLAMAAVGAAVWGFVNFRRARSAETAALQAQSEAQRTRALAESARQEAEDLLNYLLDEFSIKLGEIGQIPLYEQLTRRTLDYYQHLPAELVVSATERNRAMALGMLGSVLNQQNRTDEAIAPTTEALTILRRRVAEGDHSFETALGLSLTLGVQSNIYSNQSLRAEALRTMEQAVATLRPWMAEPNRSDRDKRGFANRLMSYGWSLSSVKGYAASEPVFAEAAKLFLEVGADDPKNESAATAYSITLKGLCFAAQARGDSPQALQHIQEALRLENALLEKSPGKTPLLAERAGAYNALASTLDQMGRTQEGLAAALQADRDYQAYLKVTPDDGRTRQWSIGNKNFIGVFQERLGNLKESRQTLQASLEDGRRWKISSDLAGQLGANAYNLANAAAESGDRAGAAAAQEVMRYYIQEWVKDAPVENYAAVAMPEWSNLSKIEVDTALGVAPAEVLETARSTLSRLQKLKPEDSLSENWHRSMQVEAHISIAITALDLGRFAEAETAAATATTLILQGAYGYENVPFRNRILARIDRRRAEALAGQERREEARAVIDPVVAATREDAKKAPDDLRVRMDLIRALLAQAVAQEPKAVAQRRILLEETRALLASLPDEMAATASARKISARVTAELAKLEGGK